MANEGERRKGPSNFTLSVGGIIGIISLGASGVATYSSLQTDIATFKRGELYQDRINDQLREEIKAAREETRALRSEQRETMKEFNEKLDRIIEHWPRRR